MTTMTIRPERGDDAAAIAATHRAAFAQANVGDQDPTEVSLVEWLRQDGDVLAHLSFVAVADGEIVGHVLCSRGLIGETFAVSVGPLGVLPPWQGQGIGSALMHAVIDAADASGEVAIALLGDPVFYGRLGFALAAHHGVSAPDPAWVEHFQLLCLSSWTPPISGTFRYAPAFDRL